MRVSAWVYVLLLACVFAVHAEDCACSRVRSATFCFAKDAEPQEYKVVVKGESTWPTQFDHVHPDTCFTVFNTKKSKTSDETRAPVEILVYKAYGPSDAKPLFTHSYGMTCGANPPIPLPRILGTHLILSRENREARTGSAASCDLNSATNEQCDFTIALVVDTSIKTQASAEDVAHIKHMLTSEVQQLLAGSKSKVALYSFSTVAKTELDYTSMATFAGVHLLNSAIANMVFNVQNAKSHANWQAGLEIVKGDPDLVLFITDENPDMHTDSFFDGEDLYGDDLHAAVLSAKRLRTRGVKIMAIGVGSNVAVSSLQAIAGPVPGQDYLLSKNAGSVYGPMRSVMRQICCMDGSIDICGVCGGDGKSCLDCKGKPFGQSRMDACGTCDGDGEECLPSAVLRKAVASAYHTSELEISQVYKGTIQVNYRTRYMPHTAIQLAFSPYRECDASTMAGSQGPRCSSRAQIPEGVTSYCHLFAANYPLQAPWTVQLDSKLLVAYYSANFTEKDLDNCIGSEKPGTLYATHVRLDDCTGTEHRCGKVVQSDVRSLGEEKPQVRAQYKRFIPLQSGDIIIEFSTSVPSGHRLSDPSLIGPSNTGIPFQPMKEQNTQCSETDPDSTTCTQTWRVSTFGATGVINFSGLKTFEFLDSVEGSDVPSGTVRVAIDLDLTIDSDPHVLNRYGSWQRFFKDRDFKMPLIDASFSDGEQVYVLSGIRSDEVDMIIDNVFLCIGVSGDPIPYDPARPHETGCHTKDVEVQKVALYDRKTNFTNGNFEFQFLSNPPTQTWLRAFKFAAQPHTRYSQMLQVGFETHKKPMTAIGAKHEYVRFGHESLANVLRDPADLSEQFKDARETLDKILDDQREGFHKMNFPYPKEMYTKPLEDTVGIAALEHERKFYDDDENDHGNHRHRERAGQVNHANFEVVCVQGSAAYYQWCGHSRSNGYWGSDDYWGYGWWFVWFFVFLVFIIIVGGLCWGCYGRGTRQTFVEEDEEVRKSKKNGNSSKTVRRRRVNESDYIDRDVDLVIPDRE